MESISAQGIRTLHIDLLNTLVIAALLLFLGSSLVARIGVLRRFSIPAPVVGGLVFALLAWGLRGQVSLGTDTTLRSPLQVAFFTTIGFGATLSLLRSGGRTLLLFWGIATGTGILQNIAGAVTAKAMGAPALLGVICGAVTLTGGPATGLAFTETFENLGVQGAGSLIIASATFGIFVASLIGNPVACALIRRFKLPLPDAGGRTGPSQSSRSTPGHSAGTLIHNLILLLLVMGAGSAIGMAVQRLGFILPAFIFPMILAAAMRLIDDRRGLFGFHAHAMDALGFLALNFFLVIALMDLKLWQLAGLAVPMLVILGVQIVVTVAYAAGTTFLLLGRDYEAAVSTSGHIGFGMGITPNAVANMQALVERFGAAPRSFLVVPVVGAFFIDLTNSFVITLFINLLR